ncbi:MAG TPA: cytochrome ubiquinol oxidase subunit I [Bacteroidales bacterium]|nr:cytochrome ubiquinol oxidase subunit I [Bacteroidales bacterium]
MIGSVDIALVDWSRAQFALTAIYHWFFVPLTLGLSFLIAIMETIYVRTGREEWRRITKFWMKLFGINFAIGIATGIILEFEFGTNWSNYSWFVGDIFGAPLAIEGILAFFLESTFIAVMFFGWNKVSRKFHLLSTWLVAFGASLSALWILVANAWMQSPVGMEFNPDTARSEMLDFWAVLLSPVAVNKFLHTITSSYVVAALFMLCVSSWFLLKKRELMFAKKSIIIASVFGLLSALFVAVTGDGSAYMVAQKQPAKLAAMEGLYQGKSGAGLIVFGVPKADANKNREDNFHFKLEVPKMLSLLGFRQADAYVPGIKDLTDGNAERNIMSAGEKIEKGKLAIGALSSYKDYKKLKNLAKADSSLRVFKEHSSYMGYGYLEDPDSIIPNVPISFYTFHIMVGLGAMFILLFMVALYLTLRNKLENKKLLLRIIMWFFPLGFIASQCGWIVTEVGRQPWAIQDLLPTAVATTHISASAVMTTFILFAVLFTILLIAEIKIMITQIKAGPEGGEHV